MRSSSRAGCAEASYNNKRHLKTVDISECLSQLPKLALLLHTICIIVLVSYSDSLGVFFQNALVPSQVCKMDE